LFVTKPLGDRARGGVTSATNNNSNGDPSEGGSGSSSWRGPVAVGIFARAATRTHRDRRSIGATHLYSFPESNRRARACGGDPSSNGGGGGGAGGCTIGLFGFHSLLAYVTWDQIKPDRSRLSCVVCGLLYVLGGASELLA
jgi:hypothetical protein